MSEDWNRTKDSGLNSNQPKPKTPYEKPSFRFEQVFVTSALSCGKVNNSEANCHLNRKVS
jgi:hypothetical protein